MGSVVLEKWNFQLEGTSQRWFDGGIRKRHALKPGRREAPAQWQLAPQWYGGNHLLAPEQLHLVTHCACYYAKGIGMGKYWYLSNYGIRTVPESAHLPVDKVCPSNYQCPQTNESAFEKWGPPWIEAYERCDPVESSVILFA